MKKILLVALVITFFMPRMAFAAFDSNLRYGNKGEAVIELQEFLTNKGFYKGPISGNFYSLTLAAVKAFQKKESIKPISGMFGILSRTRAKTILDDETRDSELLSNSTPAPSQITPPTTLPTAPVAQQVIASVPTEPAPIKQELSPPQVPSIPEVAKKNPSVQIKIVKSILNPTFEYLLKITATDDNFLLNALVVSGDNIPLREKIYGRALQLNGEEKIWFRECPTVELLFKQNTGAAYPYPCPAREIAGLGEELYTQTKVMGFTTVSIDWLGRKSLGYTIFEKNRTYEIALPLGTKIEYIKFTGQESGYVFQSDGVPN